MFSQRSFVNKLFFYHRVLFACFLVGNEGLVVKASAAILALDKSFFDERVVGLRVIVIDVLLRDFVLGDQLLESWWRTWTWSSLFRRLQVLLILPLLFAGLDVDA